MRNLLLAASGAALALSLSSSPAGAFQTVYGGLAGQCSSDAKRGLYDSDALEVCSMALVRDFLTSRDRAGTFVNRGGMKLRGMDWEGALADFDAALRLQPNMGEAHIGRGVYLINFERWAEAEAAIDRGLKLGSEEPEKGYYFRGLARWGQDDFRGAYLDFRKASQLKPNWSPPREQAAKFTVTPTG